MSRKGPQTALKQISEINLTPLMDLTFILLITFIITFPLIEQGIPINLPTQTATPISPTKSTTVTIDSKGVLHLDNVPVSDDELGNAMRMLINANPEATVFIRADEGLAYGKVVAVMKILRLASVKKMAFVTRSEE